MKTELKREITFSSAYDKRDPNPSKNYGIAGVSIRFLLKGPKDAIQFVIHTNWYLPSVQAEMGTRVFIGETQPMGVDVGYHSHKPTYKGELVFSDNCGVTGGICYYDGSGLRAGQWVKDILLPKGSDGIWEAMEKEYQLRFGKKKVKK